MSESQRIAREGDTALDRARRIAVRNPLFSQCLAEAYAKASARRMRTRLLIAALIAGVVIGTGGVLIGRRGGSDSWDLSKESVDSAAWQRAAALKAADLGFRSKDANALADVVLPRLAGASARTLKISIPIIGKAEPRDDRVALLRALLRHEDEGVRREASVWYRVAVPGWKDDPDVAALISALGGG